MQYPRNIIIPLFESYCKQCEIDGKTVSASIGKNKLKLKVASTESSLMKGLSGSKPIIDGEGMLFVYEDETPLSFWMKGVNYPLDIMFFNSNMDLVDHFTMKECGDLKEEDLPRYKSSKPARFAVEVKGGWCSKNLDENNCSLNF